MSETLQDESAPRLRRTRSDRASRLASAWRTRIVAACLAAFFPACFALPAAGSNLKPAIERAKSDVAEWTLVPKFNLGGRAEYDIRPDGTPLDVEQGEAQRGGLLWVPEEMATEACLTAGTPYRKSDSGGWRKSNKKGFGATVRTKVLWFYFDPKGDELLVMIQSCVRLTIHYGRPVAPSDLAPQALARALGGFFEISGPNLAAGSAVETRLANALEASGAASPVEVDPPSNVADGHAEGPTITGVAVEASPSRVAHGQPVELILRYEVLGPSEASVEVSQSWTLTFDGQPLPTYPTERRIARSRGAHEAALEQVIPTEAPIGVYKLRGEVCVLEDCSTRTTTFEVVP